MDKQSNNKFKIKFLVMDIDGTLTDGKIYMGNNGEVMKAFNIKDGCGIHDILIPAKITPIIITGRKSDIVVNRCKELGIKEVIQGTGNKLDMLQKILLEKYAEICYGDDQSYVDTLDKNVKCNPVLFTVAFIGDDINDLSCMKAIKEAGGKVGCPADADRKVKAIADFIAEHKGGDGAVRDFIEWLVE